MSQRFVSPAPAFGSALIDRGRKISFRLDGIEINGFAGDTVLTAVLGAGISGAGRYRGSPINLGMQSSPMVRAWEDRSGTGVPMALCPAQDGLELVTIGGGTRGMRRLTAQIGNGLLSSLGVDFDKTPLPDFSDFAPAKTTSVDVLVIGGGVAGMSAALAAARRGEQVILVEQRGRLGGDAALFGNREGEAPVLELVARLASEVAANPAVDLRLLCRAVDAGETGVKTIRVSGDKHTLSTEVETINALHTVLATGCADRLPIYPGNRLPGVVGLADAFHLASTYGIWPKGPSLFAGGGNALYHLAMLAKESGAALVRLVDQRLAPNSRHIDFAKAMGVPQEFGTRISRATRRGTSLGVETRLALKTGRAEGRATFASGSIVQSDGWRPRLTLWARAGGELAWDGTGSKPEGDLLARGYALAGSVVGLLTNTGCTASGENSIAALFGEHSEPVTEARLDDHIESPDAPPLNVAPGLGEPAYLSSAHILVSLQNAQSRRSSVKPGDLPAELSGQLDLEAIEALTRSTRAPANRFKALCTERLASPRIISANTPPLRSNDTSAREEPGYLAGRFAGSTALVRLASEDGRQFAPGQLVFVTTGQSEPEAAIGAIVAGTDAGGMAVIAMSQLGGLTHCVVRAGTRTIAADIIG